MSKTTDLLERMTPAEYHEEDPALAHGAKKVLGYGLLEEPQRFGWYVYVPISLAIMQLLSALALGRSRSD